MIFFFLKKLENVYFIDSKKKSIFEIYFYLANDKIQTNNSSTRINEPYYPVYNLNYYYLFKKNMLINLLLRTNTRSEIFL